MDIDFKILGKVTWKVFKFFGTIALMLGIFAAGVFIFDKWILLAIPVSLIAYYIKLEYDSEVLRNPRARSEWDSDR